ncbi:MAG: Rv2231c family pyridoxal phosphate-dependent protein CobC [Dermatophilaceae bacterium]
MTGPDLHHHGDADVMPGLVDLAVNIRSGGTPVWLAEAVRAADLTAYPDQRQARAAVAARHGRGEDEVLLTAGAAEAFVLIARALRPRCAVVVHPQFTEPEAALRAAGHRVERVVLPEPFTFDPDTVPAEADLVVVGNPTNPTSALHPAHALRRLVRPERLLVVDEAFMDCVPGEPQSLAGSARLEGVAVVRSLTKTWALAGLRVGYLLAEPALVRRLACVQPLWPVSSPALAACIATASPEARREAGRWAARLARERADLLRGLAAVPGVRVVPDAAASFVLLRTPVRDLRERLLHHGFAVRRGETFPGLDEHWVRVAVRDKPTTQGFLAALARVLQRA